MNILKQSQFKNDRRYVLSLWVQRPSYTEYAIHTEYKDTPGSYENGQYIRDIDQALSAYNKKVRSL